MKRLFNKGISPACEYCEHGTTTEAGDMVQCRRKGVVSPYYRCHRFVYNPTRREPKRMPRLPRLNAEDFSL